MIGQLKNSSNFWSEYWDYANIIGKKGNQIIDSDKVFYKKINFFLTLK